MIRFFAIIFVIGCFAGSGCSKGKNAPLSQAESKSKAESGTPKDSPPSESQEPENNTDESATLSPQMAAEMKSVQGMLKDVGKLMVEARSDELTLDFDSAAEKWKEIDEKVTEKYGEESWQATNSKLAIELAERRSAMDFKERRLMSEIETSDRLADQLASQNDTIEALIRRTEVTDKARRLWQDQPQVIATYLAKQARAHQALGQYREAEQLMLESLALREQVMTKVHPEYAGELHALAILYQHLDRYEDARKAFAESLEICGETWGTDSQAYATYLNDFGVLLSELNDPAAKERFEQALAVYQAASGTDSFDYAHCLYNLASFELNQTKLDSAKQKFQSANEIFLSSKQADHEMIQQCRIHLATIWLMQEEPAKAEKLLKDVADSRERVYGHNSPEFAKSLFQLGVAYGKQGKYDLAGPALEESLRLQKTFFSRQHPDVVRTSETLAVVYERTGRPADAEAVKSRLEIADQSSGAPIR